MATHSSVLAWRIPGTGEPGGLPSMGLHRVRNNWSNLAAAAMHKISSKHVTILHGCIEKSHIKLSQSMDSNYTHTPDLHMINSNWHNATVKAKCRSTKTMKLCFIEKYSTLLRFWNLNFSNFKIINLKFSSSSQWLIVAIVISKCSPDLTR